MQQTPKPDAQLPWAIPPRSSHSPLKETTQDFLSDTLILKLFL